MIVVCSTVSLVSCTGDLDSKVDKLETEISALSNQVTALESLKASISGQIASLESLKASIESRISALEGADYATPDDIESLRISLQVLNSGIVALNEKFKDYSTTEDIEADFVKLSAYNETVRILNDVIAKVNGIDSTIDAKINGVMDEINSAVDQLKAEIAAIKNMIQSIVFVPEYSGGAAVLTYSGSEELEEFNDLKLCYEVSPLGNSAKVLVAAFAADPSVVSLDCRTVATRSDITPSFKIDKLDLKEGENDVIEVTIGKDQINQAKFKEIVLSNSETIAVRIRVVLGATDIISGYTDVVVLTKDEHDDLSKLGGIVKIDDDSSDDRTDYLTPYGYFSYMDEAVRNFDDEDGNSEYNSLTFLKPDYSETLSILSSKSGRIPLQVISKEGTMYLSFLNDQTLELVFDDGTEVKYLSEITYDRSNLPTLKGLYSDDNLKAILANLVTLMKDSSSETVLSKHLSAFEDVYKMSDVDVENVSDIIRTDSNGKYRFVNKIDNWYQNTIVDNIKKYISIWTGKASFKVGGSSCTLSGTIFCSTDDFNKYGTYGILCDTDPHNLEVGNAEYQETGYQYSQDAGFEVDFRGFKPNTRYYYRAYYKFNNSDHGGIEAKNGVVDGNVIYDSVIKTFETGDNILSVDVAMCIDVTGSMSGIISTVKKNAIGFYDAFKDCCERNSIMLSRLNVRVISFRDHNVDGASWISKSPLYSLPVQKSYFNSFVNDLYATGGGDSPESGLEALAEAFDNTEWSVDDGYHRQVTILWTDAPYLVGAAYSTITLSELSLKWNRLPSGKRLILFAPYSTATNGDSWGNLDGWKNVIHEDDLTSGFNSIDYILERIIGELTSKAAAPTKKSVNPAPPSLNY